MTCVKVSWLYLNISVWPATENLFNCKGMFEFPKSDIQTLLLSNISNKQYSKCRKNITKKIIHYAFSGIVNHIQKKITV